MACHVTAAARLIKLPRHERALVVPPVLDMTIWSWQEADLGDHMCGLCDRAVKERQIITELDVLALVSHGNPEPFIQKMFMQPDWDAIQGRRL